MNKYPTEKEIMNPPVLHKSQTIKTVLDWKKTFFNEWKNQTKDQKLTALEYLVLELGRQYEEPVNVNKDGDRYSYIAEENTITFDKENPSIISTMHEFRHKLNGPDETSACRWSVQLFAKCFPKSFEKLEFKDGTHLLVRKKE